MNPKIQIIRVTLCAPGDVTKELSVVAQEIEEWNRLNWDATNCGIKLRHWRTDAVPDLSERPQGVINQQLIDDSDLIVAIFWSRLGTPTGVASSGTEEEVRRAVAKGIRTFLYFSKLEPIPADADSAQLSKVENFRAEMISKGLAWSFQSRPRLKEDFRKHLAEFMHEMISSFSIKAPVRRKKPASISQSGNGNSQIVGNVTTIFQRPPIIRNVVERAAGSITPAEQNQVSEWIDSLVENMSGMTRSEAYAHWWSRLKNGFKVKKYEDLKSEQMDAIKEWQTQQLAIVKSERRTKAPDTWRRDRIAAIKAAMNSMKKVKEEYYAELSDRLNMKRGFVSLTKLTKTDLERVYRMVLSDSRKLR
jgi:hypothetical protein